MEFLQPIFLWGLLGISIPIGIHLWNGRRGKVLDWAAMNWLSGQESQSSRSFKLEKLLLLLLRILILTVLVLLAIGLWFDFLEKSESKPVVHLVEPREGVVDEFRFELEQAMERGESVFWLLEGLPEYEAGKVPEVNQGSSSIQQLLDQLPINLDALHFYTSGLAGNDQKETLYVPEIPILHLQSLDNRSISKAQIELDSSRFLSLNELGMLQVNSGEEALKNPVYSGSVGFRFLLEDEKKKSQFLAAFAAITEVYGLSFSEQSEGEILILTDQIPDIPEKNNLYLVTESSKQILLKNIQSIANQAEMNWEEVVEKGLLPGLILEPLVDFLGLHPREARLSPSQLAQRFIKIPESKMAISPNARVILLVLFLLLFALERYLAYRTNL
jgi:hypothetical protein